MAGAFGTTGDEALREEMMAAISPFWHGNETWLVVIGRLAVRGLPGALCRISAGLLHPVLLLSFGLIFRGVASSTATAPARAGCGIGGSSSAPPSQPLYRGAAVGAMIRGIPVVNNQFAGGSFDWLRPLPVLCGIGLMLGYALLGAGWLTLKSEGALRDWAWRRIPWLAGAVLVVLGVAVVAAFGEPGADDR
jgi:cytochrome d ubiquinol oxidase subunit II